MLYLSQMYQALEREQTHKRPQTHTQNTPLENQQPLKNSCEGDQSIQSAMVKPTTADVCDCPNFSVSSVNIEPNTFSESSELNTKLQRTLPEAPAKVSQRKNSTDSGIDTNLSTSLESSVFSSSESDSGSLRIQRSPRESDSESLKVQRSPRKPARTFQHGKESLVPNPKTVNRPINKSINLAVNDSLSSLNQNKVHNFDDKNSESKVGLTNGINYSFVKKSSASPYNTQNCSNPVSVDAEVHCLSPPGREVHSVCLSPPVMRVKAEGCNRSSVVRDKTLRSIRAQSMYAGSLHTSGPSLKSTKPYQQQPVYQRSGPSFQPTGSSLRSPGTSFHSSGSAFKPAGSAFKAALSMFSNLEHDDETPRLESKTTQTEARLLKKTNPSTEVSAQRLDLCQAASAPAVVLRNKVKEPQRGFVASRDLGKRHTVDFNSTDLFSRPRSYQPRAWTNQENLRTTETKGSTLETRGSNLGTMGPSQETKDVSSFIRGFDTKSCERQESQLYWKSRPLGTVNPSRPLGTVNPSRQFGGGVNPYHIKPYNSYSSHHSKNEQSTLV